MKKGFTLVEIMIVVLIIGMLAAIAIPSFVKARNNSRIKSCVNNLRQIDGAKEQWAMENNQKEGANVDQVDVEAYVKKYPVCPAGGAYTINNVGTDPTCSLGNALDHTGATI